MGTGFHFEEGMNLLTFQGQDAPVILLLLAAGVALEMFLARREDWRVGLLLPGGLLAWRLVQFAARLVRWHPPMDALLLALAVENIPTLIFLAVYALCRLRKRRRTARQLKRTRIEDI